MQLAPEFLHALETKNVSATGRRTVCRDRAKALQPFGNIRFYGVLKLRGKPGLYSPGHVNQVAGVDNNRRKVHRLVQPFIAVTKVLQQ